MLALCKLEYVSTDIDTEKQTYRQGQCLISDESLSAITAKLAKWYGENGIVTYTITPIEDVVLIPDAVYEKILNDSWSFDELETKMY